MNMLYIPDRTLYIESFKPSIGDYLNEILIDLSQKSFDYWCSHFVSILQCLHYHVNLKNSPRTLSNYPNWSLQDLRGRNSSFYMQSIEPYLRNWSFQYFLINFLNSELGVNISIALRESITSINNFKHLEDFKFFRFESAGIDSDFSRIAYLTDQIKFRNINTPRKHVAFNSDLALSFTKTNDGTGDKLLAFGEVEGNYGHKLLKEQFWDDKHPDLDFGIGVVSTQKPKKTKKNPFTPPTQPQITLNYFKHWSGYKAIVLIAREHNIVQDFHDAIQLLIDIYYRGPNFRVFNNLSDELKEISYLFQAGFDTPVVDLLQQFTYHSDLDNFIDPSAYSTSRIIRSDS
jgi:hypothetical protein